MTRTSTFALAGLLIIGAFACQSPIGQPPSEDQNSGLLSVAMTASSIPPEVSRLTAMLTRNSSAPIRDSLLLPTVPPDTVLWTLRQIPVGTWEVLLQAFDSAGVLRYSGSTIVGIMQDRTTQATIVMRPMGSGVGTLQLFVVWGTAAAQWHLPASNPVIRQSSGGFDAYHYWLQKCWVLKDGPVYKMYYHTGSGSTQEIALATSSNGTAWTKLGVIMPKNPAVPWMSNGTSCPSVLKVDGVYKMWFNGKGYREVNGVQTETPHNGIGFAQSSDGVAWSVWSEQLIPVDSTVVAVFAPSVTHAAGHYEMWYTIGRIMPATLFSPERTVYAIVHALSTDGLTWTAQQEIAVSPGGAPWESDGIVTPYVYRRDDGWVMYYTGVANGQLRIGRAQSADGIHWARNSADPEFGLMHAAPWQVSQVAYPSVLEEAGTIRMWFSGLSTVPERWQIGYAEKQ